ncbi:winged helix-turn-helix transcriptional regulator [Microbacterium sp. CJ88]|uniref:winged helix-turn-helix transcriptional regulator n=1 Tax=Microbacterium sp. CJ88 TaxID=3445672 RepID=UPI003F655898
MSEPTPRSGLVQGEYAYAHDVARLTPPTPRWPARILAVGSTRQLSLDDKSGLLHNGIELCVYADGLSALLGFGEEQPSAVLAPTYIEGVDLVDFVNAIATWSEVPVIIGVGAEENANEQAYHALEHGARSLIALPFTGAGIAATLRSLGSASARTDESAVTLSIGPLSLDPLGFRVTVGDQPVALTPREFHTLQYLMSQAHRVVSVEELAVKHSVYGDASVEGTRVIVLRIRRKLDAAQKGAAAMLETLRGIGYRITPM